jgi:hypothetical protein
LKNAIVSINAPSTAIWKLFGKSTHRTLQFFLNEGCAGAGSETPDKSITRKITSTSNDKKQMMAIDIPTAVHMQLRQKWLQKTSMAHTQDRLACQKQWR